MRGWMILTAAACSLTTGALLHPSRAGLRTAVNQSEVSINTFTHSASGALGAARAGFDSTEYIGCRLDTQDSNGTRGLTGYCYAKRASANGGAEVNCKTIANNAAYASILDAIRFATGDAKITFHWDPSTNPATCVDVTVDINSKYIPKTP